MPILLDYSIVFLKKSHYIILALGLLDIFRALTYYQSDVFLFPHYALDSTSVWQNGCSKLKIYFLAFVLRASEIENANAGNANLELSGAGA